jgi:hypothetical protein
MAVIKRLRVIVKTSSAMGAGTDASTYLMLCNAAGARSYRLPSRRADMEAGEKNIYDFNVADGPEVDDVKAMVLVNGMNGLNPAWKILWMRVEAIDSEGRGWCLADAMLERWLDTRVGCAPAAALPLLVPARPLEGRFSPELPEAALPAL